jgi:hypothetical protein
VSAAGIFYDSSTEAPAVAGTRVNNGVTISPMMVQVLKHSDLSSSTRARNKFGRYSGGIRGRANGLQLFSVTDGTHRYQALDMSEGDSNKSR